MPTFSFQNPPGDIAFAKPKAVRMGAVRWMANSWPKVEAGIAMVLLGDVRYREKALAVLGTVSWASRKPGYLRRGMEVADGVWIEANMPPGYMLKHLCSLLESCGYPRKEVEVEFQVCWRRALRTQRKGGARRRKNAKGYTEEERIGAYAKRELYAALAEGRVPDGDFRKLVTLSGTKELLGVALTGCPLFGESPLVRPDGRSGSWRDAAERDGKPVFVNSQWYVGHLPKLKRLLERWKTAPRARPPTAPREGSDRLQSAKTVLEKCFPDGIRPASIIDRNKFARAWDGMFGAPMPSDMDLAAVLPFAGVTHGDKVFPSADAEGKTVADFAMEIVEAATGPFFYDCFFEAHAAQLTKMGVQSGAMLRDYLRTDDGGRLVFGKSSFSVRGGPESVEDAVSAAFAAKPTWTRQELEDRFPYVPGDRVLAVLAQESKFVRIAEGEYRLASAILLDAEECEEAARRVEEGVREDGFFSMADCTFERSMERNGDIFLTALQTRFFDEWLSDRYFRHGQIVCEERAKYDSMAEVRRFCRTRDEATLKQLLELEETCGLGGGNRTLATAYEEMVRVSSDRFLAPRLVAFDVAGTDATLDDLVPEWGVMPLTAVTSFVTFPPVDGWPWNGYMLESYLRRESKDFRYLSVSCASRTPCGAIVRHSAGFGTLVDALARAVVEAGVPATEEDIGKYLLDAGYIQRRRGIEKSVAEAVKSLLKKHHVASPGWPKQNLPHGEG